MRRSFSLLPLLAMLALAATPGCSVWPSAAQTAPPGLRSLLDDQTVAGRRLDREVLLPFYRARDFAPVWIMEPEREAALLRALGSAAEHGLDPAAFALPSVPPDERELLLSEAFLRYAQALAQGRVAAGEIEDDWAFPKPAFDPAALLKEAAEGDAAMVLATLAPSEPGYRRLQRALARYQAMAAGGGWSPLAAALPMKRGAAGPPVATLRQRLAAEGYLPADKLTGDYDKAVAAAVRRFQLQHGIAADGAVGAATLSALNVPAAARVEQIRANLERWREMPRHWPKNRIEVNVAAASLTAVEDGEPKLVMRTIVGADEHPTPMLEAQMTAILFNPPWRIPGTIAAKEIMPRLKHDPKYLERNHYVRVNGALRQLPGEDNALGRLKFEIPNVYDVYLHDTPARLFGLVNRNLSHGCVRLENPRGLARYVLADREGWGAEDIDRAIAAGETLRVALAHTRPVYLLYWTAFVDADDAVEFRDDIYDRDHRLTAALAKRDESEHQDAVTALDQPTGSSTPTPSH